MPTSRAALTAVVVIGIGAAGFVLTGCARPAEAQGDSLAVRVQRLEDREAIRGLLLSYGRALDRHDFNAFSALFSEQGEWVNGATVLKGRKAIFEFMDKSMGHGSPNEPLTYHVMVNNNLIEVNGDRASAMTNSIVVRTVADTGFPLFRFLGRYKDTFVREKGQWLFLRREAYTDVPAPK
jgi:uncharacterized protein (TIGR02246 family)